jgi:hypothetical protein
MEYEQDWGEYSRTEEWRIAEAKKQEHEVNAYNGAHEEAREKGLPIPRRLIPKVEEGKSLPYCLRNQSPTPSSGSGRYAVPTFLAPKSMYEEIHEDERIALAAIYGEDLGRA